MTDDGLVDSGNDRGATAPKSAASPRPALKEMAGLLLTAIFVVGLFLYCYRQPLFSGDTRKIVALGDFHTINGPKAYFLDARLRQGEFPLWDPLSLTGAPYAAHPLAMAFYPPNLIRALVAQASTPVAFLLSLYFLVLFHLIVAAAGLHLLARFEGISLGSTIVLSTAVPFSLMWTYCSLDQVPLVCTVAWTPLILFLLGMAAREISSSRRAAAWILLAAVLYGLQILAGWPQAALYVTLLYCVFLAACFGRRSFPKSFSTAEIARLARSVILPVALFGFVGALIGLALILPAAEFINHSARSAEHYKEFTGSDPVNTRSIYIFKQAQKHHVASITGWFPVVIEEGDRWFSLNLGLDFVAVCSIFLIQRFRVLLYFVLTYLAFDLTFGPPMPAAWAFEKLHLFGVSSPFYNTLIISVPLSILAGFALDAILAWGSARALPRRAGVAMLAVGAPLLVFGSEPPDLDPVQRLSLSVLAAAILVLLVFGSRIRHWRVLVVAALLSETILCAQPLVRLSYDRPGYMKPAFYDDFRILERSPDPDLRRPRVTCAQCNHHVYVQETAINGFDPLTLYSAFQALAPPGEERYYTRGVGAQRNRRALGLVKREFWLAREFVPGPLPKTDRLFPPTLAAFLSTSEAISLPATTIDALPVSFIGEPGREVEIWRQGSSPPSVNAPHDQVVSIRDVEFSPRNHVLRAYYISRYTMSITLDVTAAAGSMAVFEAGPFSVAASPDTESVFELPLPDFEKATVEVRAKVPESALPEVLTRLEVVEDLADECGRIEVLKSRANSVTVRVNDLPGPRALVFTEINYPGWSATIDGAPTAVLDAQSVYKAVLVPAGTHEVTFRYRSWRVVLGVIVSIAVFCLASVAVVFFFGRPVRL